MIPIKSKNLFARASSSSTKNVVGETSKIPKDSLLAALSLRNEIHSRRDLIKQHQLLSRSFTRDEARRLSYEGRLARLLFEQDVSSTTLRTNSDIETTIKPKSNNKTTGRGGVIESEADAAFGPDKTVIEQSTQPINGIAPKLAAKVSDSIPTLSKKRSSTRKVLIGGAISLIPADSLAPVSGAKNLPHPLATVYISEAAKFLTLVGQKEQYNNKIRSTALLAAASVLNAACSGAFADVSEPLASTKQLYLSLASCIGQGDFRFESSAALAAAAMQAWMRHVENELNIEDHHHHHQEVADMTLSHRVVKKRFTVVVPTFDMLMALPPGMESILPDKLFVNDHGAKTLEESLFELDLTNGLVHQSALKRCSNQTPQDFFKTRTRWWEKRNTSEEFFPDSLNLRLSAGHVPTMFSPLARILSIHEWESLESLVSALLPDPLSPFLAPPVEILENTGTTLVSPFSSPINDVVSVKLSKSIDGEVYNSSGASNSALDSLSSSLSLGGSSTDLNSSIHKAFLNSTGATRDHYLDFLARMQRARQDSVQQSLLNHEDQTVSSTQFIAHSDYMPTLSLPQFPFFYKSNISSSPYPPLYPFVPSLAAATRLTDPAQTSSNSSILGLIRTPKAAAVNISAIAQTGNVEAAFNSGETTYSAKRKMKESINDSDDSNVSYSVLPSYKSEHAHSVCHFRMLEAVEAKDLGAVLALFFEHCSDRDNLIDVLAIEIVVDACAKAGRSDIVFGLIWPFVMNSKIIPPLGLRFLFIKAASLSGDLTLALQLLETQEEEEEFENEDTEITVMMYQAVMNCAKSLNRDDIVSLLLAKATKRGVVI